MTIAIEPVIAPAASLSAIRIALEAIESAAARLLVRITTPRRGQAEVGGEHARRAAAVADRVLLGGAQLRRRCAGRRGRCRRGRRPGRSRSRRCRAARSSRRPSQRASKTCSAPVVVDQGDRADVGGAAVAAGGVDFAQQLVEVDLVAGALAGVAGRVDPRGAAEVLGVDAGVVGDRDLAGRLVRGPRLDQRVGGEAVAVLGRHLEARRQRLQLDRRQQFPHLRQLVPVAGGEDHSRPAPAPPAGGRCRPPRGPAARPARRARAASARRSPAPRPGRRRRS